MIKIKNLTLKNFLSIGNATQAIDFNRNDLTLVLGNNLDLGSNGSRNGTGKTSILNGLSYALYGSALTNIKRDNLINKTNQKEMLVSVEFSVNDVDFRIERGRKPNVLKLFKDNNELKEEFDEALGEMRETQKIIDSILKISHDMFKHTLALNTYTTPFLQMRPNEQKALIEQLLGITILTEKANNLKELQRSTKNNITEEEYKINAIKQANEHITEQITNLKLKQSKWKRSQKANIETLSSSIQTLIDLDIEEEIRFHRQLEIFTANKTKIDNCNKWIDRLTKDSNNKKKTLIGLEKDLELIKENKCHACGNELHSDKAEENKNNKISLIEEANSVISNNESQIAEYKLQLSNIGDIGDKPTTFYSKLDDALNHKDTLNTLSTQLETALKEVDLYEEQILEMNEKGLQDINYDNINKLTLESEHQTFLAKLLTNKDSFIRKKIIDQNLNYLNSRLSHYLDEIGLPHTVKFLSDLSVEITELGRDLDFDNLSRGERNRLILSLSWAFRDVWESSYYHINLLFVDELVDSGLDTDGVESAMHILKGFARERQKSVWLISHRDELISRVHHTLNVIKENGFSSYSEGSSK